MRLVTHQDDHDAAIAEGWSSLPVAMRVTKDDEQASVYTPGQLQDALAQGWSLVPAPEPVVAPVAVAASVVAVPRKGKK